ILNPSKLTKPLYTPPFATANHMFWQLRFDPVSGGKKILKNRKDNNVKIRQKQKFVEDSEEYVSIFLGAIPSPQEADNTTAAWAKRSMLSAKLFLKNPLTHTEIEKY